MVQFKITGWRFLSEDDFKQTETLLADFKTAIPQKRMAASEFSEMSLSAFRTEGADEEEGGKMGKRMSG